MRGKYTAPDGWLMTWDTDAKPVGYIETFSPDALGRGIHTSGLIDDALVYRRLVEFKRVHDGQLRMEI